jgi:hypothetical protein
MACTLDVADVYQSETSGFNHRCEDPSAELKDQWNENETTLHTQLYYNLKMALINRCQQCVVEDSKPRLGQAPQ